MSKDPQDNIRLEFSCPAVESGRSRKLLLRVDEKAPYEFPSSTPTGRPIDDLRAGVIEEFPALNPTEESYALLLCLAFAHVDGTHFVEWSDMAGALGWEVDEDSVRPSFHRIGKKLEGNYVEKIRRKGLRFSDRVVATISPMEEVSEIRHWLHNSGARSPRGTEPMAANGSNVEPSPVRNPGFEVQRNDDVEKPMPKNREEASDCIPVGDEWRPQDQFQVANDDAPPERQVSDCTNKESSPSLAPADGREPHQSPVASGCPTTDVVTGSSGNEPSEAAQQVPLTIQPDASSRTRLPLSARIWHVARRHPIFALMVVLACGAVAILFVVALALEGMQLFEDSLEDYATNASLERQEMVKMENGYAVKIKPAQIKVGPFYSALRRCGEKIGAPVQLCVRHGTEKPGGTAGLDEYFVVAEEGWSPEQALGAGSCLSGSGALLTGSKNTWVITAQGLTCHVVRYGNDQRPDHF